MAKLTLPKIAKSGLGKAVFNATVLPQIQKVTGALRSMSPVEVFRGWANANPITRAIQDTKFNLDYQREKNLGGYVNPSEGPPQVRFNGQVMGNDSKELATAMRTGFSTTVQEIRGVKDQIRAVVRATSVAGKSTEKSESKLSEIANLIKGFFSGNRMNDAEKERESRTGASIGPEGAVPKAKASWLADAIQNLLFFGTEFLGMIGSSLMLLSKTVRSGIVGMATKFAAFFKELKVGETLLRSFRGLGPFLANLGKIVGDIFKVAKPLMGFTKVLGGFAKAIPIIGEFVLVVFAIIDGIKGFIKGFTEKKGNFFEKLMSGLFEGAKGIILGILEPFKMIFNFVKSGVAKLLGALGFKDLEKTIKNFDIGKAITNVFTGIVDMVKKLNPKIIFDTIVDIIKAFFSMGKPTTADPNSPTSAAPGNKAAEAIVEAGRQAADMVRKAARGARQAAGNAGEAIKEGAQKVYKGVSGLLDRISEGEGTSDEKAKAHGFSSGYDVTLGYGAIGGKPSKPVSQMTLDEVDAHQTKMLQAHNNNMNSSAVGKYQIVQKTLRGLRKQLGLKGTEKYDAAMQDKLGKALLKGRGLDKYVAGKMDAKTFQNNIAQEWASVARADTGRSHYGQHTGTSGNQIQGAIEGVHEVTPYAKLSTEGKVTKVGNKTVASKDMAMFAPKTPTTAVQTAQLKQGQSASLQKASTTIVAPSTTNVNRNATNVTNNYMRVSGPATMDRRSLETM